MHTESFEKAPLSRCYGAKRIFSELSHSSRRMFNYQREVTNKSVIKEGFEMNRLTKILLLVLGISLTLGCAERARIVIPADVPEDHAHRYAYTRSVGDNHVHLSIDHRKGEIGILVTDIYEQPKILHRVKKIDAKITTPDATVRTLELLPTRMARKRRPFAASYSRQADWLKNIHEFLVEVEVPIEDKTYVVSFEYKTSPEEDIHHKHQ